MARPAGGDLAGIFRVFVRDAGRVLRQPVCKICCASTDAVGQVLKIRQITDPAALTDKDPVHSVVVVGSASVRDVLGEAFAALNLDGVLADLNASAAGRGEEGR